MQSNWDREFGLADRQQQPERQQAEESLRGGHQLGRHDGGWGGVVVVPEYKHQPCQSLRDPCRIACPSRDAGFMQLQEMHLYVLL